MNNAYCAESMMNIYHVIPNPLFFLESTKEALKPPGARKLNISNIFSIVICLLAFTIQVWAHQRRLSCAHKPQQVRWLEQRSPVSNTCRFTMSVIKRSAAVATITFLFLTQLIYSTDSISHGRVNSWVKRHYLAHLPSSPLLYLRLISEWQPNPLWHVIPAYREMVEIIHRMSTSVLVPLFDVPILTA